MAGNAGYADAVDRLVKRTELERMPLDEIIMHTNGKPDRPCPLSFNAAAQSWNHEFFWDCLRVMKARLMCPASGVVISYPR